MQHHKYSLTELENMLPWERQIYVELLMNKLKEIIMSYAISFNPTQEQKEIAEKRLEICAGCEVWVQSALRDYCDKCGCTTSAKVFSPVGAEACPMRKWTI